VAITLVADNASSSVARVIASSRPTSFHGDSASKRAPCAAAARRNAACAATGRSEIT
jgi:hypothetical protein